MGSNLDYTHWQRGYIVLPPGHGKSFRHKMIPNYIDAEALVACRATRELTKLRSEAKLSGNWTEYDKLWAAKLEKVLPTGRFVIGVPSDSIGQLLNGTFVFAGVLEDSQWTKNLQDRKGSIAEYRQYWQHVRDLGAGVYPDNESLDQAIKDAIDEWWHGKPEAEQPRDSTYHTRFQSSDHGKV